MSHPAGTTGDQPGAPEADPDLLTTAWVVLTTGTRPDGLRAALESVRAQSRSSPVLVVHNGDAPPPDHDHGPGVECLHLDTNAGVPRGRDVGVRAVDADVVLFLDDDAVCRSPDLVERVTRAMATNPRLAGVSLRIVDQHGRSQRRHVPRIGATSAARSGPVTYFLGGACALRRSAYLAVGGYSGDFFFGHEELDLAWRLLDAGHELAYDATAVVTHPRYGRGAAAPGRWYHLGRNRVLLARRRLPTPLQYVHAALWLVGGLVRVDRRVERRAYRRGWWNGWRSDVRRRPMRWATVLRMARLGRPPVV